MKKISFNLIRKIGVATPILQIAKALIIITLAITTTPLLAQKKGKKAPDRELKPYTKPNSENMLNFFLKDYDKLWKEVDSLEQKGLVESAYKKAADIYEKAKKENNADQFVKAVIFKMKFFENKEEDAIAKLIESLEIEVEKASFPIKPVLHSMLAETYWSYYTQNRWKFQNRTTVVDFVQKDIRTWDIEKLTLAVIKNHQLALSDVENLKKTELNIYREILGDAKYITKEEFAKSRFRELRPTLYEFLAHRAVDFFVNSEAGLAKPTFAYTMAEPVYFAPITEFANFKIESKDETNLLLQGVKILQDLAKFRLEKNSSSLEDALLDLDLKRIEIVYKNSVLQNKDVAYLAALQQMKTSYANSKLVGDVDINIAEYWHSKAESYTKGQSEEFRLGYIKAMQICEEVSKKYPNTYASSNATSLIAKIKSQSFGLQMEDITAANSPQRLLVTSKNIPKLYFRVAKITTEALRNIKQDDYYENLKKYYLQQLNQATVAQFESSGELLKDNDFHSHSFEIKIPALPYGEYVVIACENAKFDIQTLPNSYINFQVSDMSFISRKNNKTGEEEFFVLNRLTGKPLPKVKALLESNEYNYSSRKYEYKNLGEKMTDDNGFFAVSPRKDERNNSFRVSLTNTKNDKDRLLVDNNFYVNVPYQQPNYTEYQTFFFTDRAIYRPSQPIYFKILAVAKNGNNEPSSRKTDILPNKKVTVKFLDVNYQEVSKLELTTNEYGTASGSFIAPTGRLTGMMYLQCDNGNSQYNFRVEEYKRPKFEVVFPAPQPPTGGEKDLAKKSYKLGEKVTIVGQGKAYSGANIDNAAVKYRVVRKARFPYWRWWWVSAPSSPQMEIANGIATTDTQGKFEVIFDAVPDLTIDKSTNPVFSYTVYADITDLNGETQSGEKTVSVGYKAIEISTNIQDKNLLGFEKPNKFTVKNLNGEPEKFSGTYTLSQLATPNRILRNCYWARPDKFYIAQAEFEKDFPNDVFQNEDKMENWAKTQLKNGEINTDKPELTDLKTLKTGAYCLRIEGKDVFGETVEYEKYFTVYNPQDSKPNLPTDFEFTALKASCEVGETAKILVSSSYNDFLLRYEIWQGSTLLSKQEIALSNSQKIIEIPIIESYRGNISVIGVAVYNGREYKFQSLISVPYTNKDLDISFETFRDKLQPGQQEEWKIKIKPKLGDKMMAEMVATLYDASLDAFAKNNFMFDYLNNNYLAPNWNGYGFKTENGAFLVIYPSAYYSPIQRYYDNLNWFGFNINSWQYRYFGDMKSEGKVMRSMSKSAPMKKYKNVGGEREEEIEINVQMEADDSSINEVVVTALGVTGKVEGVKIRGLGDIADNEELDEIEKSKEDFSDVKVRTNFNETAFFEPHLQTDSEGTLVVKFTVPEALTKWKMLGFAHTKDLKYGFVENSLVTQKDLMLVPNAPRFFRENDKIVFSTKITNLSDKELSGQVKLELLDALTSKTPQGLQALAGLQNFTVKAGQSSSVSWSFAIPESVQALTYKIVAKSGSFSDGEEMTLPVLTNRMLVTETLPLPVRSKETKTFEFTKLLKSQPPNPLQGEIVGVKTPPVGGGGATLRHHKLTLEFTSNPAWYAIQALPYLMEYPYECAEQTFSRFYANSIASHIANSSPKIKAVFDSWKSPLTPHGGNSTPPIGGGGAALVSNLEKNQELKALMLEETPWVIQGQNETERKKRVGLLFDLLRMGSELDRAMTKLEKMQVSNGGFPWFDGMPDSRWITQHIVCGIGHLKKLGVVNTGNNANKVKNITDKAIPYLDARIKEDYDRLVKYCKENKLKLEEQRAGTDVIHYLYTRSFFVEMEIASSSKEAVSYYLGQVRKYWLENGIYMQGMISLADFRFEQDKNLLGFKNLTGLVVAKDILNSLKEKALHHEELGMYWKDMMNGYYWYQAPIETQALLIEAFSEIQPPNPPQGGTNSPSQGAGGLVDEMKIWLLKQKQTQDWKTTKATTEACYALLLQGTDWLADSKLAEVTVGKEKITEESLKMKGIQPDAGTGYFKTSWSGSEITPEMGKITVKNPNNVVAWGGMYWQYFEQLDKITPAETPLKINKQLFLQKNTDKGLELSPLTDKNVLKVGDLVKVRIEIRVDRAMEYVHLKDMRASCFEPVNVLSGYRYQGGLGYYETTKDASTNFFIGWLPQGTYVFEYPLRVTHEGNFSNGITSIQCMYAPEFSSHSEGIRVEVGK
jgi:uncharacterized protein YfaS (alpha-2-macroglobulin family)